MTPSLADTQTPGIVPDPDDGEDALDSAVVSVRIGPSTPVGRSRDLSHDLDGDALFEGVNRDARFDAADVAVLLGEL